MSALDQIAVSRDDRFVYLTTTYLRDWEAIVRDVVSAIEFGSDYNLDVERVDDDFNEPGDYRIQFHTSGQAQVFMQYLETVNDFVTA